MKGHNIVTIFLLVSVISPSLVTSQDKVDSPPPPPPTPQDNNTTPEETLVKEILVPPPANCERKAKNGDILHMHYIGRLSTGKEIDNSYVRGNKPIAFKLGARQIIRGWEQGAVGMCVGEKRKLTIPPSLHYGDEGYGNGAIPPKSTLIFDIELMEITDDDGNFDKKLKEDIENGPMPATFANMDYNKDNQLSREEIKKFMSTHMKEMGAAQIDSTIEGVFTTYDENKDGALSEKENQNFLDSKQSPNNNGQEATAPHDAEEHTFDAVDLDNDDAMSVEELTAYLKKYYEANKEKPGYSTFDVDKYVKEMFLQVDANKDGRITMAENQNAAEKNAELEKAHKSSTQGGPTPSGEGRMGQGSVAEQDPEPERKKPGILQDEIYIDPKFQSGEPLDDEKEESLPAAEDAVSEEPAADESTETEETAAEPEPEEKSEL